jgi:hypothetical protein
MQPSRGQNGKFPYKSYITEIYQSAPVTRLRQSIGDHPPTPPRVGDGAPSGRCDCLVVCATIFHCENDIVHRCKFWKNCQSERRVSGTF